MRDNTYNRAANEGMFPTRPNESTFFVDSLDMLRTMQNQGQLIHPEQYRALNLFLNTADVRYIQGRPDLKVNRRGTYLYWMLGCRAEGKEKNGVSSFQYEYLTRQPLLNSFAPLEATLYIKNRDPRSILHALFIQVDLVEQSIEAYKRSIGCSTHIYVPGRYMTLETNRGIQTYREMNMFQNNQHQTYIILVNNQVEDSQTSIPANSTGNYQQSFLSTNALS